ncbi:MAG: hypothetical protein MJ166_08050 [Clostridia bacterium]|nr:hypothetical protein [Clostridia bacterium]
MKNLSLKERVLLIGVGLALFVAIAYIFIIMPMDKKIDQRRYDLADRERQDAEYEAIKTQNSAMKASIQATEKAIQDIELNLFADTDIEVVENFVMSVFESTGSKYLSKIESTDVPTDDIYLPNGTIANEKLLIKRITVEYATTDGFTIPEYNKQPSWITTDGIDLPLISDAIAHMGDYEDSRYDVVGYNEFVKALKLISEEKPSCMKIHRVYIEDSTYGFVYLRAEIDLYATQLGERRVSQTSSPEQVKLEWAGRTKVDCSGGMIGMPLLNMNEKSSWYLVGISLDQLKDFVNRPYCSYFSNAILTEMAKAGLPLYEDYATRTPNTAMFIPDPNSLVTNVPDVDTGDDAGVVEE